LAPHQDQLSFNQNYMQQPMPNPEDITDPMSLALMAKAFKLTSNRQIAQPSMNISQDRQMQMDGGNGENQFREYAGNAVQNVKNQVNQNDVQNLRVQTIRNQNGLIGVLGNANQNMNGNDNLVAARAETKEKGCCLSLDSIADCSEGSDGSAEYTKLLKPILESHQVPHNDSNVISEVTSIEQSREIVEQHPANVEETRALYDSLYQNLAIEVEKVTTVNRKLKETNADLTTELA
nr:hypothetical protein [Tanacetum cinerariifolium]